MRCAIFTLAGAYGFSDIHRGPNVDPMRVAAQVASGIGFIGGGVILKEGASVRGVTTAASLWAAGALGLLVGAGLLAEAVASLGIILVMLVGLRYLRELAGPRLGIGLRVVTMQYEQGHGTLRPLLDALGWPGPASRTSGSTTPRPAAPASARCASSCAPRTSRPWGAPLPRSARSARCTTSTSGRCRAEAMPRGPLRRITSTG